MKGIQDGARVYWVCNVDKQANARWEDILKATEFCRVKKNAKDRDITIVGGGKICVRSAQSPDAIRGDYAHGAVLDEGAFMEPDVWYKIIRPMLTDKKGWAIFATTPNGFNWFRDICTAAKRRHNWKEWHFPSTLNPSIDPDEIAEARLDLSERDFRQEYEADFVEVEGAEWPASYLDDSIWYEGNAPPDIVCQVIAVDPSKGKTDKSDYSSICTVSLDVRGTYWVECEMARMDIDTLVNRCAVLTVERRPEAIGFEAVAFQELIGNLYVPKAYELGSQATYYNINHGSTKKIVRIRRLTQHLSRSRIRIKTTPGGRMLVDQMRQFPKGDYDDGPDSLEMAIRLIGQLTE